jgi:hypothetical protein
VISNRCGRKSANGEAMLAQWLDPQLMLRSMAPTQAVVKTLHNNCPIKVNVAPSAMPIMTASNRRQNSMD